MHARINVVGAVIVRNGTVLCAKRGPDGAMGGLWEFPGGKIEPGETPQQALVREIEEELRCTVTVGEEVEHTVHESDFGAISLTTFYCELMVGTPQRTEHAALTWLAPEALHSLEWAPADVPAVERIITHFASR